MPFLKFSQKFANDFSHVIKRLLFAVYLLAHAFKSSVFTFFTSAKKLTMCILKFIICRDMKTKRLQKIKRICLVALMLALTIIFCFVPIQFGTITLALMILPTIIVAQVCDFKTSLLMAVLMGVVNYIAWFTTKAASPVAPIFQNPLVCILPRIMIGVVCYLVRYGLQRAIFFNRPFRKYKDEYVRETNDENAQNDFSVAENCTDRNETAESIAHEYAKAETSSASDIPTKKKGKRTLKDEAVNQIIYALSAALGVVTNTLFVAIFTLIFFNGTYIAQNTVVTVEYVLAWFGVNFLVEIAAFSLITPPIVLALKAAKLA